MLIATNAVVVMWSLLSLLPVFVRLSSPSRIVANGGEGAIHRAIRFRELQLTYFFVPVLWALVSYAAMNVTSDQEAVVAAAALWVTCMLDLRRWSLASNVNMAVLQVGQSLGVAITAVAVQGEAGRFTTSLQLKADRFTSAVFIIELVTVLLGLWHALKVMAWQRGILPRLFPPRAIDLSSRFERLFARLSTGEQGHVAQVLQAFVNRNATDVHDMSVGVLLLSFGAIQFALLNPLRFMYYSSHELQGIQRLAMQMNMVGVVAACLLIFNTAPHIPIETSSEANLGLSPARESKAWRHYKQHIGAWSGLLSVRRLGTGSFLCCTRRPGTPFSCFDNARMVANISVATHRTLVDCGPHGAADSAVGIEGTALSIYNRCMHLTYLLTSIEMTLGTDEATTAASFAHWQTTVSNLRIEGLGAECCIRMATLIIITHIAAEQYRIASTAAAAVTGAAAETEAAAATQLPRILEGEHADISDAAVDDMQAAAMPLLRGQAADAAVTHPFSIEVMTHTLND